MGAEKTDANLSENGKQDNAEPKDRFNMVHILFFFLGLAHFLPFSFFVTATDYWMYKFRNTSLDETPPEDRTELQALFATAFTTSTEAAYFIFTALSAAFGHKVAVNFRLKGTLSLILLLFGVTTIFVSVDTDSWQLGFFLLSVGIIFMAIAATILLGTSIYTVLSYFPASYTGIFLISQGTGGILSAILQIISLALGISSTIAAIIYFSIGALTMGLTILLLVPTVNNKYFKYKMSKYHEGPKEHRMSLQQFKTSFKQVWCPTVTMLLHILTVTPVHPSITSLVVSEGVGNGPWNDIYFVPCITFLMGSCCNLLGRTLAAKIQIFSPIALLILTFLRMITYVPLIMFCNAHPRSHLPVIFAHDYQYILIIATFYFGNGYVFSACYLEISKLGLKEEDTKNAYQVLLLVDSVLLASCTFFQFVSVKLL